MRWREDTNPERLELEADSRHVAVVVKELGLENAKAMATPGVKAKTEEQIKADLDGPFLGSQMTTKFRLLTMRLAYLSEDRPEIKYAVKELARQMQKPHDLAWTQLKRLGRHSARRQITLLSCFNINDTF